MVLEDLRVLEPRLVRPPRVGPDVDRNLRKVRGRFVRSMHAHACTCVGRPMLGCHLHSLVGRLEAACKVGGRVAKVGATAEPSHAVEHLKSAAFGDPQPRVISGYLGVSRSISSPPPLAIRSRACTVTTGARRAVRLSSTHTCGRVPLSSRRARARWPCGPSAGCWRGGASNQRCRGTSLRV